ncbi:hypothetical protein BGZ83_007615 [Gryganskiella cystojenkinii]|nr:hypothetical protein BGZ83_007615 [Gryganskiella cystojenkinii]
MLSQRRYLEGTAYIVYGPGPVESISNTHSNQALHPPTVQDHSGENGEELNQDQHHSHDNDSHSHHHHDHSLPEQPHFWAVFRPEKDSLITPKDSAFLGTRGTRDSTVFFLSGTPHLWGSFPPEMPEPHGCIPPHLYYSVTLSELPSSTSSSRNTTSAGEKKTGDSARQEYQIPFVHRFGDGKDDAGGLTTAYELLEELEDADDFGVFVDELVRRFQNASIASVKSSTATATAAENTFGVNFDLGEKGRVAPKRLSGDDASGVDAPVALYACTEVLFSETRTKQMIENHFFSESSEKSQPSVLEKFKRQFYATLETSTTAMPFHLLKSDLKVVLPVQVASL